MVIFPVCNFNSSYTTGFSFILVTIWLLISMSIFPTGEHASLQIYQQRLSVRNVLSALMHTKLLFPSKRSRFNERRTDANSPSLQTFRPVMTKIKYMYTTTRVCTLIVNVSVIIEPFHHYSRNGNLSTLILIPTLPKPTAHFSVISSWRLLNKENACVCATWRTSTQCPCIYFFNHWIRA